MSKNDKKDAKIKRQVKKFMKAVTTFLKSKNGGSVPAEWECSLMILETYFEQFCILREEISELDKMFNEIR